METSSSSSSFFFFSHLAHVSAVLKFIQWCLDQNIVRSHLFIPGRNDAGRLLSHLVGWHIDMPESHHFTDAILQLLLERGHMLKNCLMNKSSQAMRFPSTLTMIGFPKFQCVCDIWWCV
jgi:hypothetical protein